MNVKDLIQIYHWQTDDFARHTAAGKLYDLLNINLDKFVEASSYNTRFNVGKGSIKIKNMSNAAAKKLLSEFAEYLTTLTNKLKKSPDLLNIRDEILADVQQTLYLFSLA
jgi:hypothetical protein